MVFCFYHDNFIQYTLLKCCDKIQLCVYNKQAADLSVSLHAELSPSVFMPPEVWLSFSGIPSPDSFLLRGVCAHLLIDSQLAACIMQCL